MMRNLYIGCVVAGLFCVSSAAQEPQEQQKPQDELEALSRSSDDPFAEIVKHQERKPVSVTLRALNKTTARYTDLEVPMNELARFGSLEIVPRYCDKRPPEEFPETTAFLEIFDLEPSSYQNFAQAGHPEDETIPDGPIAAPMEPDAPPVAETVAPEPVAPDPDAVVEGPKTEGKRIFTGWMFASSPALNALEHPVYDVWVIDCKTVAVDK